MRSALIVIVLAGCSPLRVAEGFLLGDQFIRNRDVVYRVGERGRLDVYRPRSSRGESPVVVFLYGGRWQNGSKEQYRLLGAALTRRGIIAVVPDFRLYPEVEFPGWVDDAAQAVAWTRKNIQSFGGDAAQVWVVGHSSGGHTATMLALDERYLRDAGLPPAAVRGFVSLAGPVDTIWTDPDVQALMGREDGWPGTYPRSHIDGTEPPLLLLHGADDKTVSSTNSVRLAARIRERGGCAQAKVYRGVGHVEIVVALSLPTLGIAPVLDDVVKFVQDRRTSGCRVTQAFLNPR